MTTKFFASTDLAALKIAANSYLTNLIPSNLSKVVSINCPSESYTKLMIQHTELSNVPVGVGDYIRYQIEIKNDATFYDDILGMETDINDFVADCDDETTFTVYTDNEATLNHLAVIFYKADFSL